MKYFIAKVAKRGTVGNVWSVSFKRSVIFFKFNLSKSSFQGKKERVLELFSFPESGSFIYCAAKILLC